MIGHERVVRWLSRAAGSGRAGGAYLLYGPPGAGKSTIAAAFVSALACQRRGPDGDACGSCDACRAVARGRHPDVRWVQPSTEAGSITIDQIRDLRFWLGLASGSPWGKAAVVEQADRMTLQAANALLKTLEEPAGPAAIVLLARELSALPETLRSRCLCFYVGPVPVSRLAAALQAMLGLPPEQARARALIAGGLPGRALSADPDADGQRAAAMEWVEQALEAPPEELLRAARAAEQDDARRVDGRFEAMVWLWRDVAAWRWTRRRDLLVDVELAPRVMAAGDRVDPHEAARALEDLVEARRMISEHTSRRLVLQWAWMTLRRSRSASRWPPATAASAS